MGENLTVEFKLNKVLPELSKKLGMDYRVMRMDGGFKIFTAEYEPIVYASLIDRKFELFDEFNFLPRYLRRNLIKELRFMTLFDNHGKEIEKGKLWVR